jgi:hypothetical protein
MKLVSLEGRSNVAGQQTAGILGQPVHLCGMERTKIRGKIGAGSAILFCALAFHVLAGSTTPVTRSHTRRKTR